MLPHYFVKQQVTLAHKTELNWSKTSVGRSVGCGFVSGCESMFVLDDVIV